MENKHGEWEPVEQVQQPEPIEEPIEELSFDTQHSYVVDEEVFASQNIDAADPLTRRPRVSSIVLCAVFCVLFAALAFLTYWLGVRTVAGQSYEEQVITNFSTYMPAFFSQQGWPIGKSPVVYAISIALGIIAAIVVIVRRRWWLAGQLAVFAIICFILGRTLKPLLPRPYLINIHFATTNSAPSGHTILIISAGLALVCAVSHGWRALCAIISATLTILVGYSVIIDHWHRPADVVMSIMLAGAVMMFVLAFTRTSGMDVLGTRVSSTSVQITATAMITIGVCACAYAGYVLWQIEPGLLGAAGWTVRGSVISSIILIAGVTLLVHGLVLAFRQLTASPLSRLGLIGQPPKPPAQR